MTYQKTLIYAETLKADFLRIAEFTSIMPLHNWLMAELQSKTIVDEMIKKWL
jgi:hypothetical protein